MKFWICIPVFNRLELTKRCLQSIREQTCAEFEVLVCNDGSSDGTGEYLREHFPEVHVLDGDGNLWWSAATNLCVEHALIHGSSDDVVLTLNNDLILQPDYLQSLADLHERHPDALIGSAGNDIDTGARLYSGHRISWWRAVRIPLGVEASACSGIADVVAVSTLPGRGTLIPFAVFRDCGLFDSVRLPQYAADEDLALRAAHAGWKLLMAQQSCVFFHPQENGATEIDKMSFFTAMRAYFGSRRSPANIAARITMALRHPPVLLRPSYLLLDLVRITGSFLRMRIRGG